MSMERNVGGLDRKIRAGVGAVLLLLGLVGFFVETLATVSVATMVGVSMLVLATAATQRCPINALLGINTCVGEASSELREDA